MALLVNYQPGSHERMIIGRRNVAESDRARAELRRLQTKRTAC